ncbi:MAG: hypothetical protein ACLFQB_09155 [Chitinispirillaceae bacterium]
MQSAISRLVRSFQAFGSAEVKSILREIVESVASKAVFKAEAQRSLKRIGEREGQATNNGDTSFGGEVSVWYFHATFY